MNRHLRIAIVIGLATSVGACQRDADDKSKKKPAQSPTTATTPPTPVDDTKPGATRATPVKGNLVEPPMDVSKPPEDALESASGMAYKVLAEGAGDKPGQNDTVLVNYTGWRTSGQMFYTSSRRKQPQPMSLVKVSKGWEEALLDMKPGEKRIYWMPPHLASRGKPGKDQGDLVFQIDLVEVQKAPPPPANLHAPPADAKRTDSGLAYKVLTPGTGTETARAFDQVTAHYTIWNGDGRIVDSTTIRKRPRPMQLFREPATWKEALMLMVQGQKNRVWIPENLLDKQPAAARGGVVIDFELVSLTKMNQPPPVPKDVAAPPAGAKKTENGIAYKVLKKGYGDKHPTAEHHVKVHYTGWTTDGDMFDSSIVRGKPAQFPLRGVIKGWTEGVPTMVVGETTRFWIPEELAYKGKPNRPQGMLVFDIELLDIQDPPEPKRPHQSEGGSPHGGLQAIPPMKKPGATDKPAHPQPETK